MYNLLKEHKVPMNDFIIYDREADGGENFEEYPNKIVVHGKTIEKPFVEKPFDADNHFIHVYYGDE